MGPDELSQLLHAIRRLRRATMDISHAPPVLRPFLGGGLASVCDRFASWVEAAVDDRRGADAVIRFFGLDRLPENLGPIGESLRAHPAGSVRLGGALGLTGRQVENLIAAAVAVLARDPDGPTTEPPADPVPPVSDPFPAPVDPSAQSTLEQIVLWAWAQVPDSDRSAGSALLFYEHEHGLRSTSTPPASRTERLRWRRLAWSVMQVARYRFDRAHGTAGASDAGRVTGPRRPATVKLLESDGDGLAALMRLSADPAGPTGSDDIGPATDLVRAAVRSGRPEGPELLGLFRDALHKRRIRRGSAAVPAHIEAKVLTLNVILAREHRDISGIPAGETAAHRFRQLLELPTIRRDHHTYVAIVIDYLRMMQELAELHDGLGLYAAAHRTLENLRTEFVRLGDPDPETQPDGWQHQLLLTSAVVNRHLALGGRDDPRARHEEAVAAASRSHELGVRHANTMPPGWAIASGTQRVAVTVDRLAREGRLDGVRAQHLLSDARRQIADLDDQTRRITDSNDRATRSQILGVHLTKWRIALIQGDPYAIRNAQTNTVTGLGSWTLAEDLETIQHYQQVGARLGVEPDSGKLTTLLSHVPDRAHLRRPDPSDRHPSTTDTGS